jgi:hypothetical protein
LDPDKGPRRRDQLRTRLAAYQHEMTDRFDAGRRPLERWTEALLDRPWLPRRHQPGLGERVLTQAEQLGLSTGLCLLGCVGLGVGIAYLLEPRGGPQRRALLRETAQSYWHKADQLLTTAAGDGRTRTPVSSTPDVQAAPLRT